MLILFNAINYSQSISKCQLWLQYSNDLFLCHECCRVECNDVSCTKVRNNNNLVEYMFLLHWGEGCIGLFMIDKLNTVVLNDTHAYNWASAVLPPESMVFDFHIQGTALLGCYRRMPPRQFLLESCIRCLRFRHRMHDSSRN